MKHVILIFLALLISCASFAQRNFVKEQKVGTNGIAFVKTLSCADTLGLCAYNASPQALYKDQLGGYAVGTNFFGDIAKAQEFLVDDTARYNIRKVMFFFAAKKKAAQDSFLLVNIYKIDSIGFSAGNTTKACPDTIIASRKLFLDSIDTIAGHPTVLDFEWGVSTKGKFAIGFDMSHLDTADRVGLYSTKDSSALKTELSWEKQSNGRWYTMLRSWPLDVDFAIFPIVDKTAIGIKELSASSSLALSIHPNPSNTTSNVQFTITESSPVQLSICDKNGKMIHLKKYSILEKGLHEITLPTADYASGVYTLKVQTAAAYKSLKLIVLHD
ncbi:MAG: T9SS type A sorting domain-containing protein [Bacteroidetes bacterium]|nr:T9SS type A sorting domain-containing protein [Bacteroidota bacterium]